MSGQDRAAFYDRLEPTSEDSIATGETVLVHAAETTPGLPAIPETQEVPMDTTDYEGFRQRAEAAGVPDSLVAGAVAAMVRERVRHYDNIEPARSRISPPRVSPPVARTPEAAAAA